VIGDKSEVDAGVAQAAAQVGEAGLVEDPVLKPSAIASVVRPRRVEVHDEPAGRGATDRRE
jgi:hypothetical protein